MLVFSLVRQDNHFFGHIACPGLCQRESARKACNSHLADFLCISAQLFPSWPTSPLSCWVVTERATAGIPEVEESSSWHTRHFHPFLSVSPHDCTQPVQVPLMEKVALVLDKPKDPQPFPLNIVQSRYFQSFSIFSTISKTEESVCTISGRDTPDPFCCCYTATWLYFLTF